MVWLLIGAAIYAIIFVAGRAHSRYLDRLEARRKVVATIQLFNVSPEIIKESKFTADLTSEAIRNTPIESSALNSNCLKPNDLREMAAQSGGAVGDCPLHEPR